MKKSLMVSSLVLVLGIAATVSAGTYGDAGCGLGSMLWGEGGLKSKVNSRPMREIMASTTNGTFFSQCFGITTGISNCTEQGLVKLEREQEMFVEVNHDHIARDMAAGEGEFLTAFADVLGCGEDLHGQFASTTKAHYGEIFASDATTPAETLQSVKGLLRSDAQLSKGCARI
ncbi:MAG: DUF3015 family protein [Bdellovibrionota bacterium]